MTVYVSVSLIYADGANLHALTAFHSTQSSQRIKTGAIQNNNYNNNNPPKKKKKKKKLPLNEKY